MKKFIVKIQMPIVSNEDEPAVLVYNEDKSFMTTFGLTEEMKDLMGKRLKIYFWAHIDKNKFLVIDKKAKEQNW